MIRFLPVAIELVILVFCLIDCIQTDAASVRNLPKVWWIVLIILLPIVGGIAWLVAGRAAGPVRLGPSRPTRPVAPDDDPEFLSRIAEETQHEKMLKRWEEDLRRRERDLDGSERPEDETGGRA